jgi:orotidine-5'-phosphate decarboxylase
VSNRNADLIYNRLLGHPYDSVRQLSYLALDVPDEKHALRIVDKFAEIVDGYKIGLQLFHAGGSTVVDTLLKKGKRVFLDMKLLDIPNTVAGALRAICEMPIEMVNIHALGGKRIMEAARVAVDGAYYHPLLIAVTILTSMSEAELVAVGIGESPLLEVKRLAMLAENCGMDGVVASAKEIATIRQVAKPGFEVVVPGTRLKDQAVHDQRRTLTPGEAVAEGATRLVIGRAVMQAENPLQALNEIWDDMLGNKCE